MNQHLRRVILAYLLALSAALIYVPWSGQPLDVWVAGGFHEYGFFWNSPQRPGYVFNFDLRRLLLEAASLTIILVLAFASLWEEGAGEA